MKTFLEGTGGIGFLIGLLMLGGALDMDTSLLIPSIVTIISFIIIKISERYYA